MQKYNYNHERVCEKRKCRKNVGKGMPPPNLPPPTGGGICEIGGILGGLGIPNHIFLIVFDAFTKRSD